MQRDGHQRRACEGTANADEGEGRGEGLEVGRGGDAGPSGRWRMEPWRVALSGGCGMRDKGGLKQQRC